MANIYDLNVKAYITNTLNALVKNTLITEEYDEVALGYSGTTLSTVTFKKSGATVATLTLTYSGTTLTGVTKT